MERVQNQLDFKIETPSDEELRRRHERETADKILGGRFDTYVADEIAKLIDMDEGKPRRTTSRMRLTKKHFNRAKRNKKNKASKKARAKTRARA